jgi:hypothetical protein
VGFAFDRASSSARSYDIDGRLRVKLAVLSQASVDRYYGHEIIDGPEKLGLDPEALYLMYRPPNELARAVSGANGLPILSAHEPVSAVEFRPDLLVGATLNDAQFEAPFLKCSLVIFSAAAIKSIESGAKGSLSLGYRFEPEMRRGITSEGERFDGVMRDIIPNHCALCDEGRIGVAAMIADRAPRRIEERYRNFRRRFSSGAA